MNDKKDESGEAKETVERAIDNKSCWVCFYLRRISSYTVFISCSKRNKIMFPITCNDFILADKYKKSRKVDMDISIMFKGCRS